MNIAESQVESVFFTALELHAPAERAAFLDSACGDDRPLRQRVEELLQAHPRLENFLLGGTPGHANLEPSDRLVTERPGAIVGHYKLLEEIGEGGFGVVFMAEQQQPVRRKVALKILKPGMDSRQVIARFEAERQALALMDHPNIAQVFDAGTTDSGRPFFVMELIRGIPITDYCEQRRLSLRERLELFVSVCQAVQHAHQKEVIHRDIKPSNVLVMLQDEKAVAKVIDFGVAKATGRQGLAGSTLFTGIDQFIGTPLYMSPEQAEASGLDIDTRSDIYSLGVLLYELLTGTTPFDRARFGKMPLDEIRRIIREEDPERPSARLTQVQIARHETKGFRPNSQVELRRSHLQDLDWIVMKALEKERERRYESASAFALDIQHFLADEPVVARPPSAVYRFRKFARRNRVLLSAVSLVAAALVAGTFVSTWQAIKARQAETLAENRLEAETQARRDADAARAQAIASLQQSREAVDRMLTRVAEADLLQLSQMKEIRRKLLEDALEFNQGFLKIRSDEPALRLEAAKAQLRLGSIERSLGRPVPASRNLSQAAALLESLAAEHPHDSSYRRELLHAYLELQLVNDRTRSLPVEEQSLRRAVALAVQLVAEDAADIGNRRLQSESLRRLGRILAESQRVEEAEPFLKQSLELARGLHDPDLEAAACDELGAVCLKRRQYQELEAYCRQAIEAVKVWLTKDKHDLVASKRLGSDYQNLGVALERQGRMGEAADAYELALPIFVRLARINPGAESAVDRVAATAATCAEALKSCGRREKAAILYRNALDADIRRVWIVFKESAHLQLQQHAFALDKLLVEQSREGERQQLAVEIVALYDSLLANDPDNLGLRQVREQARRGFLRTDVGIAADTADDHVLPSDPAVPDCD